MYENVRIRAVALSAALLLSLTACNTPAPQSLDPKPQAPAPLESPLQSPIATPIPMATQDARLGQISGRLFVRRGSRSVPMKSVMLFLGPIVRSEVTGGDGVVALDQVNAPQAEVQDDGSFVIRNVPPGRYGIVVDIDDDKLLLNDPIDGTAFIHEIKGNETIDLGDLAYKDLPYVERP
jgi:hypothetical protein